MTSSYPSCGLCPQPADFFVAPPVALNLGGGSYRCTAHVTDEVAKLLRLAVTRGTEPSVRITYPLAEGRADDEAPTQRLPPIRDAIGPRRRPPAPIVRELRERTELLAALVEELAAYDEGDQ